MNDNRRHTPRRRFARPRLVVIPGAGKEDKPDPCFCGSDDTFVDRDAASEDRFVSCATCGAEGPRVASYDLAVARWNAIIFCGVVDNITT